MKKHVTTRREFLSWLLHLQQPGALQACAPLAGAASEGGAPAPAAKDVQPGVPRNQCLILENPTGTVLPADDFNRWRSGSNTYSTGFQQLALDALWYIDPDAGVKWSLG